MKQFIFILITFFTIISCSKKNSTSEPIEPIKPVEPTDSPSEQKTIDLTIDGNARSFIVYLPTGYNKAGKLPLIFVLHGQGGTDTGMIRIADFRLIAETKKIVLIYPQGIGKVWNDGRTSTSNQMGINDVSFFSQLIDYAAVNFSVDVSRVYSTGLSSGGFMSTRLGCELSNRIAAIAAVGASFEANTIYPNCNPAKPTPVIYIQGTTDPLVPFNGGAVGGFLAAGGGGGYCVSHQQALTKWASINTCNSVPQISNLPDLAVDGTTVTQTLYSNGTGGTKVIGYEIINGGHTWPQGYQYAPELLIGKTCKDMNACEVIWAFFNEFKRE
jgi:polyhydroxybutyrate depolymerase